MSRVSDALEKQLGAGERLLHTFNGLSDGLNRSARQAGDAAMGITELGVVVAWVKLGLLPKVVVERFAWQEVIDVNESDDPLPGPAGAMERKNATHMLGRAMGASSTRPTVTVRTRRGDFSLFFKPKERGLVRTAHLAVADALRAAR